MILEWHEAIYVASDLFYVDHLDGLEVGLKCVMTLFWVELKSAFNISLFLNSSSVA